MEHSSKGAARPAWLCQERGKVLQWLVLEAMLLPVARQGGVGTVVIGDRILESSMLTRNAFAGLGMVAFLASMVLGVAGARAQQEGGWQAERDRHFRFIYGRMKKIADKAVTKPNTAQAMGFAWPPKPATKPKGQVVVAIEAAVDMEVREKFPEEKRREFLKEAKEMYRVYQLGEVVPAFNYRNPMWVVREGRLRVVTEQRIKVGNRWLLPSDLSDKVKARFYVEFSEKMIRAHVRDRNSEYDREIAAFKRAQMTRLLPPALMNAGYCPESPDKMQSIDVRDWWSRTEAVTARYNWMYARTAARLWAKMEWEVFQANGYVRVKERDSEWMPKAEADAYREKLRKEAAKKTNDMDIFSAD